MSDDDVWEEESSRQWERSSSSCDHFALKVAGLGRGRRESTVAQCLQGNWGRCWVLGLPGFCLCT